MKLDPKIWAALISAFIALVISIINWVKSSKTIKDNLATQKELEEYKIRIGDELSQFKIDLEKRIKIENHKVSVGTKAKDQELEALQVAIKSIQHIKNELELIINSRESDLNLEYSSSAFLQTLKLVLSSFEENFNYLSKADQGVYHDAKGLAIATNNYIKHQANLKIKKIEADFGHQLITYRRAFSNLQNILRDSRFEKFIKYSS